MECFKEHPRKYFVSKVEIQITALKYYVLLIYVRLRYCHAFMFYLVMWDVTRLVLFKANLYRDCE